MTDLVDRLRGIYRIPITDGLGPVETSEDPNSPSEFVRTFPTPPIQLEAAAEIERLRTSLSRAAAIGAMVCARTHHGTLADQVRDAILKGDPQ